MGLVLVNYNNPVLYIRYSILNKSMISILFIYKVYHVTIPHTLIMCINVHNC